MDQGELNKFVGEKMRQLAKRMADPRHPLHNRVQWRDGRPGECPTTTTNWPGWCWLRWTNRT